ncbi:MAG: hypothetical protein U9N45_00555 [Gemmatimonadota bacterium]|nr:hypothetical protein [Gemmatimonadota bacterium]
MAEPLCSYFGRCGGCAAQNIDYRVQLENKRKSLANAVQGDCIEVFHGSEYFYRTRVDMVFHKGGLGFRRKGVWHKVVDIEKCVIANEKINVLIDEVRTFFNTELDYFELKKKYGTFRYAVIRAPQEDSSVSFVLNGDSTRLINARERIASFAKNTSARNVIVTYVPHNRDVSVSDDYFVLKGCDTLEESYLGYTFRYNVQGFFQNTYGMALKLHKYVREILSRRDTSAPTQLADLYGGVGTFGIVNADLFREVTIIESFPQSVDAAESNIEANKVENVRVLALDAKRLKNVEFPRPLVVITDPPRGGMNPRTIKQLNVLRPELIVYVSCNIRQLGVDLDKFSEYRVASAALFDFFPHTLHCEAVVELVPGGGS